MLRYILSILTVSLGLLSVARADTVVFLPGLGDDAGSFARLARSLPDTVQVFNKGQPVGNYGLANNPAQVARDLKAQLDQAGATAPYILVAHSLAGPVALAYATSFPQTTRGVVLIDPRLPGFTARCDAAGLTMCHLPKAMRLMLPADQVALLETVDSMPDSVAEAGKFPALPVTVMTAGKAPLGAGRRWGEIWRAEQTEFAKALPKGKQVVVPDSGHYIQKKAPELVLREILLLAK